MRTKKGAVELFLNKPVELHPIQTFLTVATGVMLITALIIISTIAKAPGSLTSGVGIILQILTVCSILFACILLSRIETKLKGKGGK